MTSSDNTDELIARLNAETAKIRWNDLQTHYAAGNVLAVSADSDLIKTAIAMHRDETEQVSRWLNEGQLFEVSDTQALNWCRDDALFWAVVIPPFVLIQEVKK